MAQPMTAPAPNAPAADPVPSPEKGLEKFKYNALAPIGSGSSLKNLFDLNRSAIEAIIPKHLTPDRLLRTLLVAYNHTPGLAKCTQSSLIECVIKAAELGLSLSGTLGEAYLVPFSNKIRSKRPDGSFDERWVDQATLILGYRGLAKLARNSGEISRLEAEMVYSRDTFVFRQGTDFRLTFERYLN